MRTIVIVCFLPSSLIMVHFVAWRQVLRGKCSEVKALSGHLLIMASIGTICLVLNALTAHVNQHCQQHTSIRIDG